MTLDGSKSPQSGKDKSTKLFSKVACAGCRAIKVKCRLSNGELPTGEEGETCVRCSRLKIPCEYKSATRRGRKPKSLIAQEEAAKLLTSSASSSTAALPRADRDESMDYDGGKANDSRTSEFVFPPLPSTSRLPNHVPYEHYPPPTQQHQHQPPYHSQYPQNAPNLSMSPTMAQSHAFPSPLSTQAYPNVSQALGPAPHLIPALPPPPPRPRSMSSQTSSYSQPQAPSTLSPSSQPSPGSSTLRLAHSATGGGSLASTAESKALGFNASTAPRGGSSMGSPFTSNNQPLQPRARPSPTHPDPIDLHTLSSPEAAQLFHLFHERLNCFIILLDSRLHTPEYVRANSTVLFTSILAVSAKFFRTDLYQTLLLSAQQLVARGTGSGSNVDLGLIQSVLLLTYWKEPFDCSAWIRVGFALRAAYQLGLHVKRKGPLPSNDHEARLILDRERTWITLICFDASYVLTYDTPSAYETRMVPIHDVDIDAWISESSPYGCVDDYEQGASIGIIKVLNLLASIATAPTKMVANTLATHVNEMLSTVHRRYLDPSSSTYLKLGPLAQHKIRFHWLAASLQVAKSCLSAAGVSDELVLGSFISRCGQLVACFEDLTAGTSPVFAYMQDNISIQLMSVGEMLGKLFPQVDSSCVKSSIVEYLYRIYIAAHNAIPNGNPDSVPAFVSRFFRAVLRAIHPLAFGTPTSRPTSPSNEMSSSTAQTAPTPQQLSSSMTALQPNLPNPFEQLGGVEQDILDPDVNSLLVSLRNDGSYWDSLFPGQSSWEWLDNALTNPAVC